MNCRLCGDTQHLTTFDIGILNCTSCYGIYRIDIKKTDNHLQEADPKKIKKLKNKKGDLKFWKLISDEYINYLKSKTKMDFKYILDIGSLYGSFVKTLNKMNLADGVNIFLSHTNYEHLENFELLDYTKLNVDMFNEIYFNNKIKMIKFMIGLKKPYSINPDGNHVFLLLKKI